MAAPAMPARSDGDTGVVATLVELVLCRPERRGSGFAPGGRVTTHQAGATRSVFSGRGMEFDEARVYRAGDDVRAIDWRVTARTGTVHTKLFHEERERPVLVLVDLRPSMQFGTRKRFKSVLAAHVAALLSWTALDGGDRLGGFLLGAAGLQAFPSTRGRSGLLRWLRAVGEATRPGEGAGDETSLVVALRRLRRAARPGALVFVISDFVDLDDELALESARLAQHAHVTNVLIHDRLEETLPARGDCRVSDGTEVLALGRLPGEERRAWESLFRQRRARLQSLSRQHGMAFLSLTTGDEPTDVLQPRTARDGAVRRTGAAA